MPNILIVSNDATLGNRVTRCVEPMELGVFCVDNPDRADSYAREIGAQLVVVDGALGAVQMRQMVDVMHGRFELLFLVHGEVPTEFSQFACVFWPTDEQKLQAILRRKLSASLPPPAFNVTEYIQLACLARRSVHIACSTTRANGFILVVNGDVWDAAAFGARGTARLAAEEAFRFWVTKDDVWIRVSALRREPDVRVMNAHWEHLLLESMQLRDEGATDHVAEWPPESEPTNHGVRTIGAMPGERKTNRPTAPPPSSATYPERARTLVNQAIRAITDGQYAEAAIALEGALALAPDDKLVEHRLRKIRQILNMP